jgi:hypothetical protein
MFSIPAPLAVLETALVDGAIEFNAENRLRDA